MTGRGVARYILGLMLIYAVGIFFGTTVTNYRVEKDELIHRLAQMQERAAINAEKLRIARIAAQPVRDIVEYLHVKGEHERIDHGAEMFWNSALTIKQLPLEMTWKEVIECDYDPHDGILRWAHFASAESSRRYKETGYRIGTFPFRGSYEDEDKAGADLRKIIKAPNIDALCRLVSDVPIVVEAGVRMEFRMIGEPVYVGDYPVQFDADWPLYQ